MSFCPVIWLFFERINRAFPNVMTPILPIYIKRIKTILLPMVMCDNAPELNPAVAKADVASNDSFK